MPGMPEVMSKPEILERLDDVFNDPPRRAAFAGDLRNGNRLIDVAIAHAIANDQDEQDHLRYDWFNEDGRGWWPHAQNHPGGVEEVVRHGLIAAAEEADQRARPVVCFWVCDPGHEEHSNGHHPPDGDVEVTVSWSDAQITLIVQTPHPPVSSPTGPVLEPIWVIRRMPDQSVGKVQASRPARRPPSQPEVEPHPATA